MLKIPQSKIDEIQSSANLVSYISRYVNLKQTGKNFKGLCPFHKEKTPSFIVSPEKQIYHCFGCGKGGNVIGFLMEIEKVSYIEAIRRVAADAGIKLVYDQSDKQQAAESEFEPLYYANRLAKDFFIQGLEHKNSKLARDYLQKRKLKIETIKKYEIGYAINKWDSLALAPELKDVAREILDELGLIQNKEKNSGYFDKFRNRIMFPFHNLAGRIVGFGGRRLLETDQPKYLNSPESRIYKKGQILYGLHQALTAIRENKFAILVEGYFDLLRLVDSGILNVVASSGTAFTEDQGRLLRRYTNSVIISYDSDEAGITAALRNSQILEALDFNTSIIQIPAPYDPDTFILDKGEAAYIDLLRKRVAPLELQLQRFYQQLPRPTMDEKNQFINTALDSIRNIRDEIKIGMYLHQLAQTLEIAESFLISRFSRLQQHGTTADTSATKPEPAKTATQALRGRWRAEEGILSMLLLNDARQTRLIFDQLSVTDFENEALRRLFELFSENWDELGRISIHDLTAKLNDQENNLVTELLLHETRDLTKFTADCIYQIKKWTLDQRYNEIKRLMHNETSGAKDPALHYIKELNAIRKKLSEINEEHNKYLKINL
jgi:DNA primase